MIKLFNGLARFQPVQIALSFLLILFLGANSSLANEKVILALGDSLTAGLGLAEDESFPVQLEKALAGKGRKIRVINGGLSGDTTTGGLSRLDWLLSEQPDLIIIELGANDGLRALPPELTRQNLDQLIARSKATGATVLLTGMKALPNLGRDYVQEFDAIFPALADKHDVHFYPFFLDGVAADPALNQQDGIHPTGEGVAIIVDRILPFVEQALADTGAEG